MNKTAIKNYAVGARRKLMEAVMQKMALYGVTEKNIQTENDVIAVLADSGIYLDSHQKSARNTLVTKVKQDGYQNVVEEVAYTWFNRLIAIRFIEVNEYLPSGVRVLSSVEKNRLEPDCVREWERLDYIRHEDAAKLKAKSDEALYRYLLIAQCKALQKLMPGVFGHISDYTELLLPDRLYTKDSIVYDLTHSISEEDFGEQVEIIGWLYQYYISEKKDEVFAALKKNVKITRENIPAATQLFTPDWIVKYMVENSLGRIFIGNRVQGTGNSVQWSVNSEKERIRAEKAFADELGWKYYIPEAEQTTEVRTAIAALTPNPNSLTPKLDVKDIKFIDPCMGSGHILVYAFDVLYQIYQSQGYAEREIPDLILQNNLFGLDIDERACQLAYFALMMKARSYNRRFFRRDPSEIPVPQVYAARGDSEIEEYGSALKVVELGERPEHKNDQLSLEDMNYEEQLNAWNFRRLLAQKYDCVVTNPPYMGSSGMSAKLAEYVKKNYPDSKSDLFAVFIEKCGEMLTPNGFQAMITQHAWMFLSSYEKLRAKLLHHSMINMAHLGARAFEEIGGEVVQTTAFVISQNRVPEYEATYVRLVDFPSQQDKEDAFLSSKNRHTAKQENFEKIPGEPVAYWFSSRFFNLFKNNTVSSIADSKPGMSTTNNELFTRLWYEVKLHKSVFKADSREFAQNSGAKWFPYNKGGELRRWYGNNDVLVNWYNDGEALKEYTKGATGGRMVSLDYFFRECLTWSMISTKSTAFRYKHKGSILSNAGPSCFTNENLFYILGYLNTVVVQHILSIISPTLNCTSGDVGNIPIVFERENVVTDIVQQNISISRTDWDSFETSWDFKRHPLISGQWTVSSGQKKTNHCSLITDIYNAWEIESDKRFCALKANEEELNRIFINIYGLQDELTPEVEDKDVTVRKADLTREIKSLVSYAVGCMFGRYSLDVQGLAYAGGEFSEQWTVVGDQYYLNEVLREYGCAELSGINCLAESNAACKDCIPNSEKTSERGNVFVVGSNSQSSGINSVEHSGGTGAEFNEGIYTVSLNSEGLESGVANTTSNMCGSRLPCRFGYKGSDGIIGRSEQNVSCPYKKTDHCPLTTNHFGVEADNILPITDADYFDDDIVVRFIDFIKTVYGTEALNENLEFIANALYPTGSGTAREKIRRYFLNDFYKDHIKTYQKKPIYWMFDSGKENGFKSLVYLHRYDKHTAARVRTEYLHPLQRKYEAEIERLTVLSDLPETSAREKADNAKRIELLRKKINECRSYDQIIAHIAVQQIELDLDDGVTVNYAKFQNIEIAQGDGRQPFKMDLLYRF